VFVIIIAYQMTQQLQLKHPKIITKQEMQMEMKEKKLLISKIKTMAKKISHEERNIFLDL
jgi:hypothetical protein